MSTRQSVKPIAVYFISFVGLGLTVACIGPTLPSFAAVASVSLGQIGLLIFARAFGSMIGSWSAGSAVDRGRGRAVVLISVLIMACCMVIVPFSTSLSLLAVVFLVLGVSQGALNTTANAVVPRIQPGRASANLSLLHFSFAAGSMLAPLLVAWFLPIRVDGLFVYWFLAAALTPLALWSIMSVTPPEQKLEPVRTASHVPSRALGWAIVLFFLFVGAETTVGSWLSSYAQRAAQFSSAHGAYLTATFWGAFTAGRLLSIIGSTWIRPSLYVHITVLASIASAICLAVFSRGGIGLWVSAAAIGLAMAAVFPQALAFLGSSVRVTGRGTAWLLISSGLGQMALPWTSGFLLDRISARAMPALVGLSMALAFWVFRMVVKTAHSEPSRSDSGFQQW